MVSRAGRASFRQIAAAGLAAGVLAACAPSTNPPAGSVLAIAPPDAKSGAVFDPAVYRGSVVARQVCVSCHDVGVEGDAPPPGSRAPAFASLADREGMTRDKLTLAYLAPHADMPAYLFSEANVADLTAYIMSLRTAG